MNLPAVSLFEIYCFLVLAAGVLDFLQSLITGCSTVLRKNHMRSGTCFCFAIVSNCCAATFKLIMNSE